MPCYYHFVHNSTGLLYFGVAGKKEEDISRFLMELRRNSNCKLYVHAVSPNRNFSRMYFCEMLCTVETLKNTTTLPTTAAVV